MHARQILFCFFVENIAAHMRAACGPGVFEQGVFAAA